MKEYYRKRDAQRAALKEVMKDCPKEYREQFNSLLKHLDIYDIADRVRN